MRLYELLSRAGIEFDINMGDREVTAVVTDSRRVVEGCVFVCIDGLHFDGHDYINNAKDAGASVIVAKRVRDDCVGGAAIILVDNTRRAAALLYNAWFGDPCGKLKIIGITGTNGKTSVSYMIRALFEDAGIKCGLIGTLGVFLSDRDRLEVGEAYSPLANMTTPDAEGLYFALSEMAKRGIEHVVMEVTSHALALHKTDGIFFDTAVFTNMTQDHLDFHGSMEEYFKAKKRLFSSCRRAIINIDDAYGQKILSETPAEGLTCSMEGRADFCALNLKPLGAYGSRFSVLEGGGETEIKIKIPGRFSVMNALQAFAVAAEYGIDKERAALVLSSLSGVPGRLERVAAKGGFCAYIDYAHTPDALEKLLLTAHSVAFDGSGQRGRIILLFGCGGDRDRGKRRLMGAIASKYSDLVIITSDNSRSEAPDVIFSDILRGIDKEKPYVLIESRAEAIKYAVDFARAGDIILLAGKGHEKYEINSSGRQFFDERALLLEAIDNKEQKNGKNDTRELGKG